MVGAALGVRGVQLELLKEKLGDGSYYGRVCDDGSFIWGEVSSRGAVYDGVFDLLGDACDKDVVVVGDCPKGGVGTGGSAYGDGCRISSR